MIYNYIKIAFRNIRRQKFYSLINISGLAIGMACFILIILFINHEFSYDNFHRNADNIYRVAVEAQINEDFLNVAVSAGPLAPEMEKCFPEVVKATRLDSENESVLISYNDRKFYENKLIYADTGFFQIFSFKMLRGNPSTALSEKYSLVFTESTAKKIFCDEDPFGKIVRYNDKYNLMVTGIVEDPPDNSHIDFNLIISFKTLRDFPFAERLDRWGSMNFLTYIQIIENYDHQKLEEKLPEFISSRMGENLDTLAAQGIRFDPYLQPLKKIHLHSHLLGELQTNGDINYVYIFLAIAIFILIIACINFVNLATARSTKRAKEVGLRKTLGANKSDLIIQFIGESVMLSFFALLISMILIEIALPTFNELTGKNLVFLNLQNWPFVIFLFIFAFFVGVFAGLYPAFYLSSFQPIVVIKGRIQSGAGRSFFRNALVIFQFFISITLIISTIIIIQQFHYLKNIYPGFEKEQVIIVPLRENKTAVERKAMKNEFLRLPQVKSVSFASNYPGTQIGKWGCSPEGTGSESNQWIVALISIDEDYIETLEMKLLRGRNFSIDGKTEEKKILINETLANKAGWKDPVGKRIYIGERNEENKYTVIGLVEDSHFSSLREPIESMIFILDPQRKNTLLIKTEAQNMPETIEALEEKWMQFEPSKPFDYFFLSNSFSELYSNEEKLARIFTYFTVLTIIIACLGLFGLSSFTIEQRTKEIGVRKVFGATTGNLIFRLSVSFVRLVLIANIIAWPVAYYFMSRWLHNFAYPVNISFEIFILAGFISIIIALLTVFFIALKAASTNPINTLRYE